MNDPERPIDPPEEKAIHCPICGQAWPEFQVEDINHVVLGCEACLTIRKDGVIQ